MKKINCTLLFLEKENKILLAMKKRGFGEGRWNGIGGKITPRESTEDAMLREAEEEIGVIPEEYRQVADIKFDQYFKGERSLMNVAVFMASRWRNQPTESDEMKPQWYDTNSLPYDQMWQDDSYWLPIVLEGKKIKASFVMDENDKITAHSITEVTAF